MVVHKEDERAARESGTAATAVAESNSHHPASRPTKDRKSFFL